MNGYTIENSIDLLEKDVKALKQGGGGGGASNWGQLQNKPFESLGNEFYNLDGELTLGVASSDKIALPDSESYQWNDVSEAVEALAEDSNHFSDDLASIDIRLDNIESLYNFSTTPQNIGKWIDGKDIYRVVFECNPSSVVYDQTPIPHNIPNIGNIIKYEGFLVYRSGTVKIMPNVQYTSATNYYPAGYLYCTVNKTGVVIMSGSDIHQETARFIVYFTEV